MKLNLGCGGFYKKDYLNVDAFDNTIADKKMSAVDLNLKDNTIEEIECSQLIEHLGLIGSIYMLSECFRVLQPEGTLIIETPDLKTSFKKYITGDREVRKNILPWIYGLESPGMRHKFCYPDDLLEETIKKIGFTDKKKIFYELNIYQPVLKITCKKPRRYHSHQFLTSFRKKLIQNRLIDLQNQIIALEQEKLIDFFSSKIKRLNKPTNNNILDEIAIEGAICSPEISYIFFETLLDKKIIEKEKILNHLDTMKTLIKLDFPSILCYSMRKIPNHPGEQKILFQTIANLGKATVKNLLNPSKKSSIIKRLSDTKKKLKPYDKTVLFSEKILLTKANLLFQQGSKEFILNRYDRAVDKFRISIGFYRNQLLSYWNLGRLFALKNEIKQSKKYYNKTLDLIMRLESKNKKKIKERLQKEINEISFKKHAIPLISLDEVVNN